MVARAVLSQEPLQLFRLIQMSTDQPNPYMQMDGKAIFDFAVKTVSKGIKALVEEKGEPDYFLLHQANIRILDIMAKKNRCQS